MRIVSDFKDYYDVGMGQGHDSTLMYRRFPKKVELDWFPFPSFSNQHLFYYRGYEPRYGVAIQSWIVGFCGRIYPVLELSPGDLWGKDDKAARAKRKLCYNLAEVDTYVRNNFRDEQYQHFLMSEYTRNPHWPYYQRHRDFKWFFEGKDGRVNWDHPSVAWQKYFEEERCPVFVAKFGANKKGGGSYIEYNGCLKELEFYRKFDAYQAFQEIAMWLGNQAEPRKPIPEISDEVMAEIKGFDKWSFRKPPKNS